MINDAKDYLDEHKSEVFSILQTPSGGIIATPNYQNETNINDMEHDKPLDHRTQYFATHQDYINRLKEMGLWKEQPRESGELGEYIKSNKIVEEYGPTIGPQQEFMPTEEEWLRQELEELERDMKKEERAVRYNAGKPRYSLLPYAQLEEVVRVLEYGSNLYGDYNWMLPMDPVEIWESAMRHMVELSKGIVLDKQTGLSHSAHIITNMMFYMYHMKDIIEQAKTERNGKESTN